MPETGEVRDNTAQIINATGEPGSRTEQAETLEQLRAVALNIAYLTAERERFIQRALGLGVSERRIAKVAGLSNVAIHNRRPKETR